MAINDAISMISKWFAGLQAPVQGAIISAIVSALIGTLIAWLGHIKNTRPQLVFMRRPDAMWRVKNNGPGAAFDVYLEARARGAPNEHERFLLYPIKEGEEVSLGQLKYGDELFVYYRAWKGLWRRYTTTCKEWRNKVRWRPLSRVPRWDKVVDETRLVRGQGSRPQTGTTNT